MDTRTAPFGRALAAVCRTEARLFLREPASAFFAIAFPSVLVVGLGSVIPGFTSPSPDLGGQRPIDGYLPVTLASAIATVTMIPLLGTLAGYRERGVLRRLSTTPVSPAVLLGAQLVVNATALLLGSALAFLGAWLAFDVAPPGNVPAVAVTFLFGTAAMGAVALLVAAVAPSTRASSGIGSLIYFPMLFFAGMWTPGPSMPETIRRIADFTPLGAASQALQDAWVGDWPRPVHLLVMAAYAVCFGVVAARTFRWD